MRSGEEAALGADLKGLGLPVLERRRCGDAKGQDAAGGRTDTCGVQEKWGLTCFLITFWVSITVP